MERVLNNDWPPRPDSPGKSKLETLPGRVRNMVHWKCV